MSKELKFTLAGLLARCDMPGYQEHVAQTGRHAEGHVFLTEDQWQELRTKFSPPAPPTQGIGLGDIVGAVATPIARALKLDCIDPATQQLKPDSGCAKRKAWLNRKAHL